MHVFGISTIDKSVIRTVRFWKKHMAYSEKWSCWLVRYWRAEQLPFGLHKVA